MKKISFFILHTSLIFSYSLWGASFIVSTNSDSGSGSLRQAILDLNSTGDPSNTITINAGVGTITLGSNLPLIANPVTITGNNAVIDGTSSFRSFAFASLTIGTNAIDSVTIQNCLGKGGDGGSSLTGPIGGGAAGMGGGVLFLSGGSLDLSDVIFSNNKALGGSAIVPGSIISAGGGGGGGMGGNGTDPSSATMGGDGGPSLNGTSGGIGGNNFANGGNGSFGSGGGGGGSDGIDGGNGGNGGFGAGGGAGGDPNGNGGDGGFGGGGGEGGTSGGNGGFGAGNGANAANSGGGGGAGLGGCLFINQAQQVVISNSLSLSGNTAEGGVGFQNGSAFGPDIFMMSGSTLVFNLTSDLTIPSAIKSDQGAGGGSGGGLVKQGTAKLTLSGVNNYTGGTTFNGGILSVGADNNLGVAADGLIFNGGTLQSTGSFTSARTVSMTGAGTIDVVSSQIFTMAGIISGTGMLTKTNTGTLILTGANAYSGGTTVSAGILQGNTISLQGNIIDNAQVVFDQTGSGTYSGAISGSGSVIKQNSGTLDLTGANTYTGGTIINAGTLALFGSGTLASTGAVAVNAGEFDISGLLASPLTIGDLSGSGGTVNLGPNSLIAGTSNNTSYAGVVEGSGALTKQGTGTLILTGANTYSGGTTVSAGTLQGNTTSLQGDILDNATVVFDQATTGTYSGIFSGAGSLVKEGAGTLDFLNDSSGFAGTVAINAGTFLIDGKLGGICTVFSGGTLGGNGTIGTVINNGIVAPGSSIGTLTINGNYTQGPIGTLDIEIAPSGATDLLQVTGTATLNGTLHISPEPGIYLEGTTYTFLTAATRTGQFSSSFTDQPLNYIINYFPNRVQLFLRASLILPIPNSSLTGNARAVADYLLCPSFNFNDTDLNAVVNALLKLPISEYSQALNKLTPSPFGALPLMELENNFNIANTFFVAGVGQRSYCYIDMNEPTSIWVNPLGFIYSQEGRQEAPGFTSHTYGVTGGMDHLFSDHWSIGLGLGYSHEQLHWKHQVGKAHANSAYLGPYLKFDSEYFYLDFLVLGAGNFYDVDRKITFPGFSREAHSNFNTWNISEIILAGVRLEPFNIYNFFIQPELMLDQLNVFQEDIQENNANSVDLSVRKKYSAFLRSLANAKFVKEFCISNIFVVPSLNIGWLRTTPLTGSHYTTHFRADTFCAPNFTVKSFHEAIDQLLVGVQLLVSCQGDFQFSIGYEGNFGKGTKVNEMNINMRWRF